VGAIGLELHRRISAVYGRSERLETVLREGIKDASVWRFESRVAESVIEDWLGEFSNIQVIKVHICQAILLRLMSSSWLTQASLASSKTVVKIDGKVIRISLSSGLLASAKVGARRLARSISDIAFRSLSMLLTKAISWLLQGSQPPMEEKLVLSMGNLSQEYGMRPFTDRYKSQLTRIEQQEILPVACSMGSPTSRLAHRDRVTITSWHFPFDFLWRTTKTTSCQYTSPTATIQASTSYTEDTRRLAGDFTRR
jgi:hypothetical protein